MRFDVNLRAGIKQRLESLAEEMLGWDPAPPVTQDEISRIHSAVQPFDHCTRLDDLEVAGAHASGDFPSVSYAGSFVYVTVVHGVRYASDAVAGLREQPGGIPTLVEFTWVPEDAAQGAAACDQTFCSLAGRDVGLVIERSDYRHLKREISGRSASVARLRETLIRPAAADASNLAIQLRATGELGAALRLIEAPAPPQVVLVNGTLSLPLASRSDVNLFFEHLKRLCCVEARSRGVGFFAISVLDGLPMLETIEGVAREKLGVERGRVPEHWYLRVPVADEDGWELSLARGRQLAPPGAVTYLVRFDRGGPILRVDMGRAFWRDHVLGSSPRETAANELTILAQLDYTCHDQRSYGFPYPLRAARERTTLTKPERVTLRKQIIEAGVKAGLRQALFREPAAVNAGRD